MSKLTFEKEITTPATPPSGYIRFYPEGTNLKYVDDTGTVYTLATGVTPEEVQDIVGAMMTDTASIDFTYNDAGNTLSAVVLAAGVNHNALQNYVANQHIDHSTVSISAGTGLSGGGDLTASRTISMPNVGTAGSYGSATQVASITTDAQGRVSAASNTTIAIPSTAITDFAEATQDVVGAMVQDSSSIDATYNDVGNTETLVVLPAGVNHNALQNYVANEHIDHSSVTISAGSGLTGGGDITANRTISMPAVGTASTYGSASQIPVLTTDAQGRVSSVTNTSVSVTASAVSDFTEATQDVVGALIQDSSSIDVTYNDAGNTQTLVVLPGGVNHNALLNYVANQHVDHTTVSISAGAGLTGGGDISANRTISMPNVGTAGTYGSASQVSVITTDAQGRVSAAVTTAISILSSAVTDFASTVRSTALTGYTLGANVAVAAADTILEAFGKVQAQINAISSSVTSLGTTKADKAITISAGTGLSGGGDLSANRTLNIANTTVTAGTYGSAGVPQITVNAQGQITAASDGPALVIGDNFQNFSDLTAATTTSNTYADAASWTTTSKSTGTYRVGALIRFNPHANNNDVLFRLLVDGTQVGPEFRQEFSETATQQCVLSLWGYVTFATVTTHTITVQFRTETNASGTLTCSEAYSEIWRAN
jgi:hypothetical protein